MCFYDISYHITLYFIPLCLDCKFRDVCRDAAQNVQPPIPNSSRASGRCYKYIGRWIGKAEGSPSGFRKNFGRLNGCKCPLAKVLDFVPLKALSGPETLDPDLARFRTRI